MTLKYSHTQKGRFWFYFILVLFGAGMIALFATGEYKEAPLPVWIMISLIVIWTALMMSALSVKIDNQFIRIAFGGIAFRKRFLLSQIADCQPVRNSWFWGWGIRFYFKGWLYNIDGLNAVELHFKNGKQIRIGTDDPQGLAAALKETITAGLQQH